MKIVYPKRNFLLVLIAPSGGGKSTVKARILAQMDHVAYSVSYTTRPPRVGEKHGVDYFFVDETEFREMIARDEFLEHARVHGHYYGTSKRYIEGMIASGKHVLLDLDVQGALSLRATTFRTVTVFLLPPTIADLERRLNDRGTDSRETIELRLTNAREEVNSINRFDYLLINDDLDRTTADLVHIIRAEENRVSSYLAFSEIFYGGTEC